MKNFFRFLKNTKAPLEKKLLQSSSYNFFKATTCYLDAYASSSLSAYWVSARIPEWEQTPTMDNYLKFFTHSSRSLTHIGLTDELIDSIEKVIKFLEERSQGTLLFESACFELQSRMTKPLMQIVEEAVDASCSMYGAANRADEVFFALGCLLRSIRGQRNIFVFCEAFRDALKEIIENCLDNNIVPEMTLHHPTTQILLEAFPEDLEKYIQANPERLVALLPYIDRIEAPLCDIYINKVVDIAYRTMNTDLTLAHINARPQFKDLVVTQLFESKLTEIAIADTAAASRL